MKASGSHPERVSYKVGQIEKIRFSEVKEKEIKITSRKLDFEDVENKRGQQNYITYILMYLL